MSMAICEIHNVDLVDILQVEGSPAQEFSFGLECPICGMDWEEALTEEEQDWVMWLSSMWDDTSDDEPAIEDDYEDIRRGC